MKVAPWNVYSLEKILYSQKVEFPVQALAICKIFQRAKKKKLKQLFHFEIEI